MKEPARKTTASQARRAAKVALELARQQFQIEVQRYASVVLKRRIVLRLTPHEQNLLFNLQMWSQRRTVTVKYILSVLLPYWVKVTKAPKRTQGLGIRITTLCGQKSQEILDEAIIKDFPTQENIRQFRSELETQALASGEDFESSGLYRVADPLKFIKAYKSSLSRARKVIGDLQEQLSRRPWRGNPYR